MTNNLEMIQKLTLGLGDVETVNIVLDDDTDYDFVLRPLSDGELTQLQVLENKPYVMRMKMNRNGEKVPMERKDMMTNEDNEMDISMGEFTKSQAKAMYTAIAWSLSIPGEPEVPVKAVEGLSKGVPELLFNEVIRISKLTENDLKAIKNFRKF